MLAVSIRAMKRPGSAIVQAFGSSGIYLVNNLAFPYNVMPELDALLPGIIQKNTF